MAIAHSAEIVVIGAGSAGSVVAARVTENARRSVLLLEAGPDYADPAELPADLADGRRNSMIGARLGLPPHADYGQCGRSRSRAGAWSAARRR